MKYRFKTKNNKLCKYNNNLFKGLIFLTISLIIIFTFFLLSKFNQSMTKNLFNISKTEIKRVTNLLLTNKINNNLLNEESLENILIINKNANNEIIYVDFNLDNAYKILDNITNILTKSLKNLEDGEINIAYFDKDLSHKTNSLILNIPLGSVLSKPYFANLGPKIPTKINFIGTVLTNLETKITNYGLNNALVEVYVYINLSSEILIPFKDQDLNIEYRALIASMMIEGEVPSFYNGVIKRDSNIISSNIE